MTTTNTTIHLQMWRSFLGAHFSVVKYLERRMQEQHGLPLAWWDVMHNWQTGRSKVCA